MNKNELRKLYKLVRSSISNKDEQNTSIYNQIICDKEVINASTILIYVSTNDEVDTKELITYFLKNKKVAVPKVIGNDMYFYYINSLDDLESGYFGILEPTTNNIALDFNNSVCIVPGICFDKNNNRIGYGKGFYDRFLKDKDIYTIGLSFKECIVEKIDNDPNDIKLKKVITAK